MSLLYLCNCGVATLVLCNVLIVSVLQKEPVPGLRQNCCSNIRKWLFPIRYRHTYKKLSENLYVCPAARFLRTSDVFNVRHEVGERALAV